MLASVSLNHFSLQKYVLRHFRLVPCWTNPLPVWSSELWLPGRLQWNGRANCAFSSSACQAGELRMENSFGFCFESFSCRSHPLSCLGAPEGLAYEGDAGEAGGEVAGAARGAPQPGGRQQDQQQRRHPLHPLHCRPPATVRQMFPVICSLFIITW